MGQDRLFLEQLLSRMTLEEKVGQLSLYSADVKPSSLSNIVVPHFSIILLHATTDCLSWMTPLVDTLPSLLSYCSFFSCFYLRYFTVVATARFPVPGNETVTLQRARPG